MTYPKTESYAIVHRVEPVTDADLITMADAAKLLGKRIQTVMIYLYEGKIRFVTIPPKRGKREKRLLVRTDVEKLISEKEQDGKSQRDC